MLVSIVFRFFLVEFKLNYYFLIRRIIRLDINAVFRQILGQNSSLVDSCISTDVK